jgi:hypothetical protein
VSSESPRCCPLSVKLDDQNGVPSGTDRELRLLLYSIVFPLVTNRVTAPIEPSVGPAGRILVEVEEHDLVGVALRAASNPNLRKVRSVN